MHHPTCPIRLPFPLPVALLLLAFSTASLVRGAAPREVNPALPSIPERSFRVTDFGAAPDGTEDGNTAAFAKAIAAVVQAGGGRLIVPAGVFRVGHIELAGRLDLHLEKEARLLFSTDPEAYRIKDRKFRPLVGASGVEDVAITGEGVLDGQGSAWWSEARKFKDAARARGDANEEIGRPRLLVIEKSRRILLEAITLTNSPQFHCVVSRSEDFTARGVTVRAPEHAPNTDGIDPAASRGVLITGCTFDTGDDCIAIKSGRPDSPVEDVLVEKCRFLRGHGMSVGSETNGGLRNLVVRDCVFDGTDAGIRLKSPRGRGGVVENCTYENLTMRNVGVAIYITSYYPERLMPKPGATVSEPSIRDPNTPSWRNITIRNITARDCRKSAGIIVALPEEPLDGLLLENVSIDAPLGLRIACAQNVLMKNVNVKAANGPAYQIEPSARVLVAKE